MACEAETMKISYMANKKDIKSQSGIKFNENEHILRIIIGYDDKAIRGIRLMTNMQKIKLGTVYDCDFIAESDKMNTDKAIIGFQFVFGEDRIVEISIFSAPVNKKLENFSKNALKKQNSVANFNSILFTVKKPKKPKKANEDILKSTFKLYKRLKKSKSI